jgi:hypothetical protein
VDEEGSGDADVVDAHELAGWRLGLGLGQEFVELGNAGGGAGGEGPGGNGVDADALGAELGGYGSDPKPRPRAVGVRR